MMPRSKSNPSRAFMVVLVGAAVLAGSRVASAQVPLDLLHSFANGVTDGGSPEAALIEGTDGNFYGTTFQGGASGLGTVFKMTPRGAVSVLHSFAGGATDGANPRAGVILGTDGNFYGTTQRGGASIEGTVFKMTPAGTVTVLHSFVGGADGAVPDTALIQGADGNFYGTTIVGGASNAGTVFTMSPAGTVTVLHAFAGGTDGASPFTALIQAIDGNFYGTTFDGGASNAGTVFTMTPDGTVTVLHSFARGATDGGRPMGTLIQATDGNLYGTTFNGGTSEFGTVFRMTPAGTFNVLHSFVGGATDGAFPWAGVIQGTDGNFYGTTEQGGPFDTGGTVFRMTSAGVVTVLHAFARGTVDGAGPIAALIQAADGTFYGTTVAGGFNALGTAFRFQAFSCVDRLTLSYTSGPPTVGGTLNVGFTLQSPVPTTWSTWIIFSGGIDRWSVPIPAVSPAVSFNVPLRGFPAIGPVGILTALSTPAQGVMCLDLKVVDTGSGALAAP